MKYMLENPASADPGADIKRFSREIRLQMELNHPNIVAVLGVNTVARPPWFAMELANESLRDQLNSGSMSEADAVLIFSALLDGMEYAHSEGVLHRDLKPENVLRIGGRYAISDFGLGRHLDGSTVTLTATNAGMGTPWYAAPEQWIDAHAADGRADIYSLGKIFYELLTGLRPFPTLDINSLPPRFRWLVSRCVEQSPARRYPTVASLKLDFQQVTGQSSSISLPADRAEELLDEIERRKPSALSALEEHLVANVQDEVFYKEFVPYLRRPLIAQFQSERPAGWKLIVERFIEMCQGGHPFSYTDVIAEFLTDVYETTNDLNHQRLILDFVIQLGVDHHRWHVREMFVRMVLSDLDPSHIMMIKQVMEDNVPAMAFTARGFKDVSLPPQLRDVVNTYL